MRRVLVERAADRARVPVGRLEETLMVGSTGFQSRYCLDVPVIRAGLTLVRLPIVAVCLFGQRFFVRGLVSGALKGL